MISKETIQKNLMNCLDDTSFLNVPGFTKAHLTGFLPTFRLKAKY